MSSLVASPPGVPSLPSRWTTSSATSPLSEDWRSLLFAPAHDAKRMRTSTTLTQVGSRTVGGRAGPPGPTGDAASRHGSEGSDMRRFPPLHRSRYADDRRADDRSG